MPIQGKFRNLHFLTFPRTTSELSNLWKLVTGLESLSKRWMRNLTKIQTRSKTVQPFRASPECFRGRCTSGRPPFVRPPVTTMKPPKTTTSGMIEDLKKQENSIENLLKTRWIQTLVPPTLFLNVLNLNLTSVNEWLEVLSLQIRFNFALNLFFAIDVT